MPTMKDNVPRVVWLGCTRSPITDNGLCVRFPFSETYQAADVAVRRNAAENTPAATTQNSARDRTVDCLRAEPTLTRMAFAERLGRAVSNTICRT